MARKTAIFTAGCAVVMGLWRSAAAADVRWNGPAECGDVKDVVRQVEELIGRSLDTVDSVDFEITISKGTGETWQLELRSIERASGEARTRQFSGRTCNEVTDAAAVAISMSVQSQETKPSRSETPNSEQEGAPSAVETRAPPKPAPVPKPRAREVRGTTSEGHHPVIRPSAALSFVGDVGALPNPGAGAELSGSLGYESVRATLLGALFASQSTSASGGVGGEFQLAFGAALLCFERLPPTLGIVGCAGFELGRLDGKGTGATVPHDRSAWWEGVRAEGGVNVPLNDAFSVAIRVGAVVPLSRPEFVVDDTSVHRPAALTGRASVGMEIRF